MSYYIKRSNTEVDEQLNLAVEQMDKGGSRWSGMSYEEGVYATLMWVIGDLDDKPIEDE